MENLRKHIKLVTTKKRSNYFISKPAFHTAKFFTENLLAIKMKKTEILKTKPVSFWLSILHKNNSDHKNYSICREKFENEES